MRNSIKGNKINNGDRFIFWRIEDWIVILSIYLDRLILKKKNLASMEWQLEVDSDTRN